MISKRKQILLTIPLILAILGCQMITRAFQPRSTSTTAPALTDTATEVSEASGTSTPTEADSTVSNPDVTITPKVTRVPRESETTTPSAPTVEPTPLGTSLQMSIFEKLWKTVDTEYLYPDFNGADWNAVHTEFKQKVEAGLSNDHFYAAMEDMIFRLNDDHSVFLSPDMVKAEDEEYAGEMDYVGIGVIASAVPEKKYATILLVFPGGPAEKAGLKAHDNVIDVDGKSILDENGHLLPILRGPEGTTVTITVQTPGEQPRQMQITRHHITGSTPVPYEVLTTPNGKRIGYLLLSTFADSTIDKEVGDALKAMTASGKLDGVILDNRFNTGGADTVLKGTLSYFIKGNAGTFINREKNRTLTITGNDIGGSQKMPVVVLVGKGTVSFGEIFTGIMKDLNRAYIIGETSEGNVEILWGYDFDDGSRAWIAHDSFRPLNHPTQNWEKTGIIPDETVLSNWDEVTNATDPVITASLKHFDDVKP